MISGCSQSNMWCRCPEVCSVIPMKRHIGSHIGLYRDVWIAAIAPSRKSLATQTAAICVHFQGRRVRHEYVTMQITFLTRKSALIYRRGLHQRVASLTLDCNGVFAIRAYALRPRVFCFRHRNVAALCEEGMRPECQEQVGFLFQLDISCADCYV